MGAVSLSLVNMQKETEDENLKAAGVREENLKKLTNLVSSAETSFSRMERKIEEYPRQVERHLEKLSLESEKRAKVEKWRLILLSALLVTVSFAAGFGGWKIHEKWGGPPLNLTEMERFAIYLSDYHEEELKKYMMDFQVWKRKNDLKKK